MSGPVTHSELDARVAAIAQRVNGPDPGWLKARTERACKRCGESFLAEHRAEGYCKGCRAERELEAASGNRGGSPSGRVALDETSLTDGRAPVLPRASISRLPLRAGDFRKRSPKKCECGARGEWPGRKCPECRSGRVRAVA